MSNLKKRLSPVDLLNSTQSMRLHGRLRVADLWEGLLERPAPWILLFFLLATWALMPGAFLFTPEAQQGTIADRDYIASRDLLLPDEDTTLGRREQARDEVLPLYDFDLGAIARRDKQWEQLFARGRRLIAQSTGAGGEGGERRSEEREPDLEAVAAALAEEGRAPEGLRISPAQAEMLARERFSRDLEDRIRGAVAQVQRRGIVGNKSLLLENRLRGVTLRNLSGGNEQVQVDLFDYLGHPGEVREVLESEVRDWSGLTNAQRVLVVDLMVDNLQPNLFLNQSETLARRTQAETAVGEVFSQIRKGQVIVRKGDVIDAGDARAIAEMRGERQLRRQLLPLLGTVLLVGLVALVIWAGLVSERVADHSRRRVFAEAMILLLISLLGAKFSFLVASSLSAAFESAPLNSARSYSFAIPFASLALVSALLLGRHAALLLSALFSVLVSRMMVGGDSLWIVFYALAGSLAAIDALSRYQFRHRLVMARVGLVVGVINALVVLIVAALGGPEDRGLAQVAFDLVCAFAGGLLMAAVVSFALPILESLLGITTDIKLVEISNTNLPLLRRLAFEAPGTFQHSLMVANLAKEGCEAIGADPVLAYAGGLYHDVGKLERPDYFIENQRPGQNRHDKLVPSMSALILINHVKDGLELAREHNLPRAVRDAIGQHHGTRLIKYFYNRAVEQRDPEAGDVTQEKYRYSGPKPQSKVMGILMIADAVEAASRTLVEPTPVKLRGLIRAIVEDCLAEGQLDETDLTLSDLRVASEAFLRVLANIFHQRIDYPGFDFNAGAKREKRALADASNVS